MLGAAWLFYLQYQTFSQIQTIPKYVHTKRVDVCRALTFKAGDYVTYGDLQYNSFCSIHICKLSSNETKPSFFKIHTSVSYDK